MAAGILHAIRDDTAETARNEASFGEFTRSAFPLKETLEEISAHSGSRYDPEVVAACLSLFLEKGFQLEGI